MKINNKRIAQTAILAALAIIFGYVEGLFPLPVPIYGVKVGISNSVILSAIYMLNGGVAFGIMFIKTICSALLFQGYYAFLYSFSGGILSVLFMYILKKSGRFSVIGVSVAGGVMHNIGQLICAGIVLKTINIMYYLPILIICGIIAGVIIGVITNLILKRIENKINYL